MMRTLREYARLLRRLRELHAARWDNPLVVHNDPRRRVKNRVAYYLPMLAGWVAGPWVAALAASAAGTSSRPDGAMQALGFLALGGFFGGIAFMAPLARVVFTFFARRTEDADVLSELATTPLQHGEVAFGSAYWPARTWMLWLLPLQLSYLALSGSLAVLGRGAWQDRDELLLLAAVAMVVATAAFVLPVLALANAAHAWLEWRVAKVYSLALTLVGIVMQCATAIAGAIGAAGLVGMTMDLMSAPGKYWIGGAEIVTALAIPALLLPCAFVWRALRFAGDRYFAPLFPEALAERDWRGAARLSKRDPEARGAAIRDLWRRRRGTLREHAAALAVAAAIVAATGGAALLARELVPASWLGWQGKGNAPTAILRAFFGYASITALYLYWSAALMLVRGRGGRREIPAVASSPLHSALRSVAVVQLAPVLLYLAGALVAVAFSERLAPDWWFRGGLEEMLMMLVPGAFILTLGVALSLLPQRRRVFIAVLWMLFAAAFHIVTIIDADGGGSQVFLFGGNVATAIAVYLVWVLVAWTLGFGIPMWSQRIHEAAGAQATGGSNPA